MGTSQFDIHMDSFANSTPTLLYNYNSLQNKWNIWAHLPHDTEWSISSYKQIYKFTTVEETIAISETLPDVLVKNCMLFIMKDGIMPIWEDPNNKEGGCFSYKISNKHVYEIWKNLTYVLLGETISTNSSFVNNVNGITISPKKNFCIVKIWMKTCEFQNPTMVTNEINGISPQGCLFKKHEPVK